MADKGMPAFGNTLKVPQIEAPLTYIRRHESPTNVPSTLFRHPANPTKPGEFE
jgi:mono/diheme cytochrome c family protein